MTAMVLILKWLCTLLAFISVINIIAAISWMPPLISQLFFTQAIESRTLFTAWLF